MVNVENSVLAQNGTALDALIKTPGIQISREGSVSLRGKAGVMVLIDGRDLRMSEEDLPNFLKSMASNSIESIELITNPPAKYDASGISRIINIKLKKVKKSGYNATFTLGANTLGGYNAGISNNMRKDKTNTFIDYNYSKNIEKEYINMLRTLLSNGNLLSINQRMSDRNTAPNHSIKTGIDYALDSMNTLSLALNANFSNSENSNDIASVKNYQGKNTTFQNLVDAPLRSSQVNANAAYTFKP